MDGVEPGANSKHDPLLTHAGGLRALAFELVGDDHAAEDVLQDTFVRALAREPGALSPSGLRGWLREVVRGIALNHRRNAAHRAEREAAYARERPATRFDAQGRGEVLRRVVEAVLALDEPYKTVVLLRYFEGLAPGAIAERTSTPLATVASRLQRAHEMLRARLGNEFDSGRGGLALALAPLLGRAWVPPVPAARVP